MKKYFTQNPKPTSQTILWIALLLFYPLAQAASPFGNEIIYQIITDRFSDGNSNNNCGENESGLTPSERLLNRQTCDPQRMDWNKYWGGDFKGIQNKLTYLKNLGITQIWISPIIENARGYAIGDGTLKTSYHGFWGRDWFRLNEHWTSSGRDDWESFDQLISEAKKNGIGVLVDTVVNHSSPAYDAEFGAFYEKGKLIGSYPSSLFHTEPGIIWELAELPEVDSTLRRFTLAEYLFQHELRVGRKKYQDWESFKNTPLASLQSLMLENYKLADLADFDETHPQIQAYMKKAHLNLLFHGISGFRVDTVRHMPISYWAQWVKDLQQTHSEIKLVGEWFGGGPANLASMNFVKQTQMTIFDFQLRGEIQKLLSNQSNLKDFWRFLSSSIDTTSGEDSAQDLITFIDNHDLPRLLSEGISEGNFQEGLKLLFALRGVPCIYYGSENLLHNKTHGGRDPYNRDWMSFKEQSDGISLIKSLTQLRKVHPSLRFGKTQILRQNTSQLLVLRSITPNSSQNSPPNSMKDPIAIFIEKSNTPTPLNQIPELNKKPNLYKEITLPNSMSRRSIQVRFFEIL